MSVKVSSGDTDSAMDERCIYRDQQQTFNPIGFVQGDIRSHGSRLNRVVVPVFFSASAMYRSFNSGRLGSYKDRWIKATPVRL